MIAHGPETHEVAEQITGGQLVVPNAEKISPTSGPTADVLGVAITDGDVEGSQSTDGLVVTAAINPAHIAVGFRGVFPLTFATAAAFGQRLVPADLGQVQPYDSGVHSDDQIIGICVETTGATAGNRAKVRLTLG
ncbi:hypothetical protein [Haloechinothrix alba]|uniref:hypothetical protein n=1 Tax=Haloechinothrix alba TaxID=664784 RepID=UPI000B781C8C|nr:hypothetical protein [Haloechinothrix alba]